VWRPLRPHALPYRAARSLRRGRSHVQKDVCVFLCCNFFTKFPVITVCSELGPFVTVNLCDDTESRFSNSTTETQPQLRTQM
jgi:hypothetical protein